MNAYLMFYHLYFDKPLETFKVKGEKGGKQTSSKSDYQKVVEQVSKK